MMGREPAVRPQREGAHVGFAGKELVSKLLEVMPPDMFKTWKSKKIRR